MYFKSRAGEFLKVRPPIAVLRAYPLIRERVEVTRGHETVGLI
jgi:hypothetical protein